MATARSPTVACTPGALDSVWLEDCELSCFEAPSLIDGYNPKILEFVDSDQDLFIYGSTFCGWEGCILTEITHVEPVECAEITPVGSGSWGRIKASYR